MTESKNTKTEGPEQEKVEEETASAEKSSLEAEFDKPEKKPVFPEPGALGTLIYRRIHSARRKG